jgi:hypothetical protein
MVNIIEDALSGMQILSKTKILDGLKFAMDC